MRMAVAGWHGYFPGSAGAALKQEMRDKINGYPTKVLVSPGGKMLDLQLGAGHAAIRSLF
jgi:hypothetical protein